MSFQVSSFYTAVTHKHPGANLFPGLITAIPARQSLGLSRWPLSERSPVSAPIGQTSVQLRICAHRAITERTSTLAEGEDIPAIGEACLCFQ